MSSIGRTLATVVAVAWSSWSCASTAPDATPEVAAIIVSPATSTLALNAQLPLQAQVQDGSGIVVPDAAITWTVQDPKIVSVSAAGVVTGLALGTSQVAANALGKSGIATIVVIKTPVATVALQPNHGDVTVGATFQLSAAALDANGAAMADRAISWATSNSGVATVNASGLVTGVGAGTTSITAASEGKSSISTVTVSQGAVVRVDVTPPALSLQSGQTQQLVASPKDAKGNPISGKTVIWSSDNLAVATVVGGAVAARSAGSASISATVDGISGKSDVTVAAGPAQSVSISPSSSSVAAGQVVKLTATVKDASGNVVTSSTVAWTSDDVRVADPASTGKLTADVATSKAGSATITASVGGVKGAAAITVNPGAVAAVVVSAPSKNLKVGSTMQITATALDNKGNAVPNQSFYWSSSNTNTATVSASGIVTGKRSGNVTITAATSQSGGKSGAVQISVK